MSASDPAQFVVIGCNHHHTPLALRERMALTHQDVDHLLDQFRKDPAFRETVILNTCNRLEIYAHTDCRSWELEIAGIMARIAEFPVDEFLANAYRHCGKEAIDHSFAVAAGLDSQMVGENQILGQMKSAYSTAADRQALGPVMHRVFQKAFQAAKWARTATQIGNGQISLGNVGVELASRIFGRLTVSRTLIVGSGKIGREMAKAFRSRGVACMSIASRTPERAHELARHVDGLTIPFKTWEAHLAFIDIAIFATRSQEFLLHPPVVHDLMHKRRHKPLFLMDLAMPRDIDPAIGEMQNVYLYNLEDLSAIANENLKSRKAEIDRCRQGLLAKADHLWQRIRQPNGTASC